MTEDELGKVIEQNKNAMTQSSEENAIYGTTLQPIDDIRGFIIVSLFAFRSFYIAYCHL